MECRVFVRVKKVVEGLDMRVALLLAILLVLVVAREARDAKSDPNARAVAQRAATLRAEAMRRSVVQERVNEAARQTAVDRQRTSNRQTALLNSLLAP